MNDSYQRNIIPVTTPVPGMKDKRPVFADIEVPAEMLTAKNINEMKLKLLFMALFPYMNGSKAPDGDMTKLLDRLDRLQEKLEAQERSGNGDGEAPINESDKKAMTRRIFMGVTKEDGDKDAD
ncbi:MAG TPA: hypothetical protein PLT70_06975 [bacterium]|nr:hypothetical protein [bacterium]